MNTLITFSKKHIGELIIVLMLIWTVSNLLTLPQIAAAGIFCGVMCPTVTAVMDKKHGIAAAITFILPLNVNVTDG